MNANENYFNNCMPQVKRQDTNYVNTTEQTNTI